MKWIICFFTLFLHVSLEAQVYKIGYLFDSQSASWQKDQTLVVKDGVIAEKNPPTLDPNVEIIDLSKKWVLPAFIDAHTHLFLNDSTFSYDFSAGLKKWVNKNKEEKIKLAQKRARQMREVGFTLARDLGNHGQIESSDIKRIKEIKIVSSGAGFVPLLGQLPPASPKELALEYRLISQGYQDHPYPLVKIYADEEPNHHFSQISDLKMITKKAHQDHKLVAVHAILEKGIDLALESGADTLEHGTFMSAKQLKKLAGTSMIFVPTNAQALFLNPQRKSYYHEDTLKDFKRTCHNVKEANRQRIPIAYGSDHYFDFPGEHFGENLVEILQSFRQCGLRNNDLLKMITFTAAHTQNQYRVGKLDVGYLADFNVYEKSPAMDLKNLLKIEAIYRDGKLVNSK